MLPKDFLRDGDSVYLKETGSSYFISEFSLID